MTKTREHPRKDPEPAKRADAKRNIEALLKAAMAVFAKSGVDAPVREMSRRRLVVGVGTVAYRHFHAALGS